MGTLIIIIAGLAAAAFLVRRGVKSYRKALKTECSGECGSCCERDRHGSFTPLD